MKHLKLFEKFTEDQLETVEDLFIMYIVDKWGAVDATKVPKETGEDYQNWLNTPISYRIGTDGSYVRCAIFLSPKLIDVDAVIEDTKKFINRVQTILKPENFSCKADFQKGNSGIAKKVYQIVIKI
jgi:hypothetical protein